VTVDSLWFFEARGRSCPIGDVPGPVAHYAIGSSFRIVGTIAGRGRKKEVFLHYLHGSTRYAKAPPASIRS